MLLFRTRTARIAACFILVLLVFKLSSSQTTPSIPRLPIDPRALALAPTSEDLAGFRLAYQRMYPGLVYSEDGSSLSKTIPGVSQIWSREDGAQIYFACVVADSSNDAANAFADWRRNTAGAVVSSSQIGDFGVDTSLITGFVQGNAFAVVTLIPTEDPAPAALLQIKSSLVSKTIARFLAQGVQKRPPFAVYTSVLSKHVKPSKKEVAKIQVSTNVSGLEMEYEVSISRSGTTVYHHSFRTRESPYIIEWNGVQSDGQKAHNGRHRVDIIATDVLGRVAISENIGVEVGK